MYWPKINCVNCPHNLHLMALSGHACRKPERSIQNWNVVSFIFLVKHLEDCDKVFCQCAVDRAISMGPERSSSLGPEWAVQMLCVTVPYLMSFLDLTLLEWYDFSESTCMITKEVFKLLKLVFWRKSCSLHSFEQDLYGYEWRIPPPFFSFSSSFSSQKATPEFWGFYLSFPFSSLSLSLSSPPPLNSKKKKEKKMEGVQEWWKREFVSFLSFLS